MRSEAEPWWRQAEADLDAARRNLAIGIFYAASWFSQQAVEKALKALYVEQRGALPPRTHDLDYLGTEVKVPTGIEVDLRRLTQTFDLVRYPDAVGGQAPVDLVTSGRATDDLAAAERVTQWIDRQLP